MNAKELRVGNLVSLYGTIATIQREDFGSAFGIAVDKGEPVPITEERLVKAGFSNDKDICYDICVDKPHGKLHEGFYIIRVMKHDTGWWIILDENKGSERGGINLGTFHYIHQIQNIVHGLTGKELEIK